MCFQNHLMFTQSVKQNADVCWFVLLKNGSVWRDDTSWFTVLMFFLWTLWTLWTLTLDLQRTGGSKAERADVLKKLEPQELQQFFMALIGTLMFVDLVAWLFSDSHPGIQASSRHPLLGLRFAAAETNVLVCTDIAQRGIDLPNCECGHLGNPGQWQS